MQRWYFLNGDVSWRQYGAKWYTRMAKGEYKVLEFINFEDATGEKYTPDRHHPEDKFTYVAEVKDLYFEYYSQKEIGQALDCCTWNNGKPTPLQQVDAMNSYGYGDQVWFGWSNNAYKLLQEAKSY